MANVINLKYSSVASKVPQTTDLVLGELAINTADGIIYLKDNSNNIISVKRQRSDAEVKTAYENNSDTNIYFSLFTDFLKTSNISYNLI